MVRSLVRLESGPKVSSSGLSGPITNYFFQLLHLNQKFVASVLKKLSILKQNQMGAATLFIKTASRSGSQSNFVTIQAVPHVAIVFPRFSSPSLRATWRWKKKSAPIVSGRRIGGQQSMVHHMSQTKTQTTCGQTQEDLGLGYSNLLLAADQSRSTGIL